MSDESRKLWIVRGVTLVVILGGWQLVGSHLNPIFLSTPSRVAMALGDMWTNGKLPQALWISLLAMAIGFSASMLIGIPLGIVMGRSRTVEAALDPYINAMYVTPRVALIPLILIWFGIGVESQIIIIFLSSIFPMIVNSHAGVRDISHNLVDTARAFCANERQLFTEVILPAAVPFIMTGLRLGVGQAVIGLIVGQMFLALAGLGKLLVEYGNFYKTDYVFGVVVVVGLLGIIVTESVRLLERRVAHWKETERAFS